MPINDLADAIKHEEEMVAYYEAMASMAPNPKARGIALELAQNKRDYVEILKKQVQPVPEERKVGQEHGAES